MLAWVVGVQRQRERALRLRRRRRESLGRDWRAGHKRVEDEPLKLAASEARDEGGVRVAHLRGRGWLLGGWRRRRGEERLSEGGALLDAT